MACITSRAWRATGRGPGRACCGTRRRAGAGASRSAWSRYAAREGQTVAVEDEKIHGTQRVSFTPTEAGVTVALELDYTPKERRPGMVLVDLLFIRRPQRESLQRTLRRFRTEVAAEREGSL